MQHTQSTTLPPRLREMTLALISAVLSGAFWCITILGAIAAFASMIWLPVGGALALVFCWCALSFGVYHLKKRALQFLRAYAIELIEFLAVRPSAPLKEEPRPSYEYDGPSRRDTGADYPVYTSGDHQVGLLPRVQVK